MYVNKKLYVENVQLCMLKSYAKTKIIWIKVKNYTMFKIIDVKVYIYDKFNSMMRYLHYDKNIC